MSGEPAEVCLVLATRNPGKLEEMTALLAGTAWSIAAIPRDIPDYEETGETFQENARGKAVFASRFTDAPVLADDSGLEIDALDGEPGVRSARYIDPAMPQAERNQAVLDKLTGIAPAQRTARFVCHLALAHRRTLVHETIGTCEGRMTESPRGDGGFGYDPIFEVPALSRTFAEVSQEEKSALSHRGAAARAMAEFLQSWEPDSAA